MIEIEIGGEIQDQNIEIQEGKEKKKRNMRREKKNIKAPLEWW